MAVNCGHPSSSALSFIHDMMTTWPTYNTHYIDVIMTTMASQITSLTVVYSNVYSDADQRKHQSSASLAFVRGIHRGPVNSPHKGPVTRQMFPFDDVIMEKLAWSTDQTVSVGSICRTLGENWEKISQQNGEKNYRAITRRAVIITMWKLQPKNSIT